MRAHLLVLFIFTFGACVSAQKKQESLSLEKRIVLPVSKSELWSALTNEDELGQWWHKGVKLEPKAGGLFYEPWGDGQLATGKVLSLNPEEFIEFTWKEKTWDDSQETLCRFTLQEKDNETVLVVNHSGWESFEEPESIMENFETGWDFFLGKLMRYFADKSA